MSKERKTQYTQPASLTSILTSPAGRWWLQRVVAAAGPARRSATAGTAAGAGHRTYDQRSSVVERTTAAATAEVRSEDGDA